MSYLALKDKELELSEFQKTAPQITEEEARAAALDAILASLFEVSVSARGMVFRNKGLWVHGKNQLLYRDKNNGGKMTPLDVRTVAQRHE